MDLMYWVRCSLFMQFGCCFENLCLRPGTRASQSSTYSGQYAQIGIDGVKSRTSEKYCSHTSITDNSKAWYQVDLGSFFSLKNIIITYRDEKGWRPYRFRQFYMDVSNMTAISTETLTSQRVRCYNDITRAPAIPPNVINIPCKQTARYVIVETIYDAPEDGKITAAILEICEIEIYGCAVGRYGNSCTECQRCSVCDIINGVCPCSHNCSDKACNSTTGTCTEGCVNFNYGNQCEKQCQYRCSPRTCDRWSGMCSGCYKGYYGSFCNETCSPFCKTGSCFQSNGKCVGGCKANWIGDQCDTLESTEETLDPASVGLGVGVGAAILLFIFGSIIAIIIYIRSKRRKTLDNKTQDVHSKEYENKNVVINRENNQEDMAPNIFSIVNMDGASEYNVDVYENEHEMGFKIKTDEKVSNVDDAFNVEQKNDYLSISETVKEESIYDQLHL